MSRRDPHIDAITDFLQPFIDGKVSRRCDLVRMEKEYRGQDEIPAPGRGDPTPARHRGHTWCHDNPFICECPCHWTEDQIALKLIEYLDDYEEPEPIVGTWLGAFMGRQTMEANRLRSLAHGRDEMVKRVTEALTARTTS